VGAGRASIRVPLSWLRARGRGQAADRLSERGSRLAGWTLIVFAALFTLRWLSEIVPDMLAGNPSRSATIWKVPTNPVHVLDLALFLPAVAASGVLLLRRTALGYLTAPGNLVFLALTCLPILVTPAVAEVRGHDPSWSVTVPIGVALVAATAVLTRTLTHATRGPDLARRPRTEPRQ
jgi:hypothetical protein